MKHTSKKRWPLFTALGLYAAVLALLAVLDARRNGGHLIYALDDTYIHLAVARSLSRSHVWGLSSHVFAGCSSSPLWILVLAAWDWLGLPLEMAPLALNAAAGAALLVFADRAFARRCLGPWATFTGLLGLCFVVPLPTLVFVGMEHTLHALLAVMLLDALMWEWARGPGEPLSASAVRILVLVPLAVGVRYESLAIVAVAAFGLAVEKRRIGLAVAMGAAALAPVALYGVFAVSHGSTFLPSSVVAKGALLGPLTLGSVVHALLLPAFKLQKFHDVLMLALGMALLSFWPGALPQRARRPAQLVLAVILLHAGVARFGTANRYEAYLFAMGIFVAVVALGELPAPLDARLLARARWSLVVAVLAATPFVSRAVLSARIVPGASAEIYRQQVQMARFLARYYPGRSVALNDIGAVALLADSPIVDLAGLASIEVLRAKQSGTFDAARIEALTRDAGVQVAMVYDTWFDALPSSWQKVGELRLATHNGTVVVSEDRVAAYAVAADEAPRLARSLAAFAAELPDGATFEPRASPCAKRDDARAVNW